MCRSWLVRGALFCATWSWAFPAVGQARDAPGVELGRGHLELSVHARATQAAARAERAAWLTLSVPLERSAVTRVVEVPTHPAAPTPAPADPAPAPVSFQQLRSLAAFTRQATAVALSVVHAAAERERLDSLSARARSSALLPELRLRVLRNSDKALRWIPSTDDPYRITQADGTGLGLEGSMTFRLDRLVFAQEELAVERIRQDAGDARLKLEARVVEALLGVFRAREQACLDDGETPERPQKVLQVLSFFAELDALTAGWFSDQAPGLGRAVWGFPEAVLGACSPPNPPPAGAPTASPSVVAGSVATFAVASPAASE